jgi:hypothetical protein
MCESHMLMSDCINTLWARTLTKAHERLIRPVALVRRSTRFAHMLIERQLLPYMRISAACVTKEAKGERGGSGGRGTTCGKYDVSRQRRTYRTW